MEEVEELCSMNTRRSSSSSSISFESEHEDNIVSQLQDKDDIESDAGSEDF